MPGFFDASSFGLTDPDASAPQPSLLQPLAWRSPAPTGASPTPAASIPLPRARPPIFPLPPDPSATGNATNNNIGPAPTNPLAAHALTLMALGAGIAQGGIGRGLAMASAAAQNERNLQAQQASYLQTYKALTDGGVPQDEALAATLNPSLMRTLAARYLGPRAATNAGTTQSAPPNVPPASPAGAALSPNGPAPAAPPIAGLRQAPDGKWYLPDPSRSGKYLQVQ
jgi:hypothetical protein